MKTLDGRPIVPEDILKEFQESFTGQLNIIEPMYNTPLPNDDPKHPKTEEGKIIYQTYHVLIGALKDIDHALNSNYSPHIYGLINKTKYIEHNEGLLVILQHMRENPNSDLYTLAVKKGVYKNNAQPAHDKIREKGENTHKKVMEAKKKLGLTDKTSGRHAAKKISDATGIPFGTAWGHLKKDKAENGS